MTLSPPGESTGTPGPSAATGNRDSTGPARASRHRYRGPKPQVSGEAPAPRSRPAHMAGWRSPLGAGTPGWPHSSPQKHPRPLPAAGPRQEGVKLESRNSPLRASPGPPLPPPPQRKGPRAAAPAGRLSRAGRAPHPLPAPGHRRAPPGTPHLSPAPGIPGRPAPFRGTLRLSLGIPHHFPGHTQPFSGPEHPRIFPQDPRTPRPPRRFPGYPAFPPELGASVPPYTRTPTPAQGTPGHRTSGPDDEGVAGPRSPRCPRGAEPQIGRCGGARPGHPTGEGMRGVTAGGAGRGVTRGLT